MNDLPARLLVVTDRKLVPRPVIETVRAAINGGATWIWLRDRDLQAKEREDLAAQLIAMMAGRACLTIGGDVEFALRIGARGVHLPAGSDTLAARALLGPRVLIGVSAHGRRDIDNAKAAGADYVTLSPIFPSASKPGYGPALGVAGLSSAAACGLPILALGGVTALNAKACLEAGAAGIAVMGGVCAAPDPHSAARAICEAIAPAG
ncbi:thiamine phosphate synthase [Roseiarcaceae bacterium H3SJ34-1]|uniref:thiamine phosphate synthase n=1 Tax=Terripilifer ovatus TaxID=3032367 RepID=UPI003AB98424|nr:thiamine phosphate synthase [Roseiarcaceae bacterium H3SJ34-1]